MSFFLDLIFSYKKSNVTHAQSAHGALIVRLYYLILRLFKLAWIWLSRPFILVWHICTCVFLSSRNPNYIYIYIFFSTCIDQSPKPRKLQNSDDYWYLIRKPGDILLQASNISSMKTFIFNLLSRLTRRRLTDCQTDTYFMSTHVLHTVVWQTFLVFHDG